MPTCCLKSMVFLMSFFDMQIVHSIMHLLCLLLALTFETRAAPSVHGASSLTQRGRLDGDRTNRLERHDGTQHGPYRPHRGGSIDLKTHPWVPPTANAQRSPCPLLNTLANHGFLFVFPWQARLSMLTSHQQTAQWPGYHHGHVRSRNDRPAKPPS